MTAAKRFSPLHDVLKSLRPVWIEIAGMPSALRIGSADEDAARAKTAGLCDITALPRLTVKGPAAARFLTGESLDVPEAIFEARPVKGGGLIARTGSGEFFIEDGPEGDVVSRLERSLRVYSDPAYPVLRQDASLLLAGNYATEVLLQTCGYDFRRRPGALVMTRVAGISCSVLYRRLPARAAFQLWADGSYGVYLWETLLGIIGELGGGAIGMMPFYGMFDRGAG